MSRRTRTPVRSRHPRRHGFPVNVRPSFRSYLFRFLPLLWALLVFVLLTMPGSDVPSIYFWTFGIDFDKFAHGVLFFIQAALLWFAFIAGGFNRRRIPWPILSAGLLSFLYGAAMEVYQSTLPDRSADWNDALADGIGAAFFMMLASFGLGRMLVRRFSRHE